MTVGEVLRVVEAWAPRAVAWERDNVGLQCGDLSGRVNSILVSLDATPGSVREAVRSRCDLLITHHPLLFRPLQRIDTASLQGRLLRTLLSHRIALAAAHTNLDFSVGGTSHALAQALGLREVQFLRPTGPPLKKVAVFVPASHASAVASAMAGAGAGVIGNYDQCSFRLQGVGTFRGNEHSSPRIGSKGTLEHADETRIEMIAPSWRVASVLRAIKAVHPYEEPACDVFTTDVADSRYGMGLLGSLPHGESVSVFLRRVKRALGVTTLRTTAAGRRTIRRVAVCGGAGSELLEDALGHDAHAFVTSDVKYHTFHDATGRILLVDAGHYETENPVIPVLVSRLREEFRTRKVRVAVRAARTVTNPVVYV